MTTGTEENRKSNETGESHRLLAGEKARTNYCSYQRKILMAKNL